MGVSIQRHPNIRMTHDILERPEFILKDMVKKQGISDQFEIASAATSTEEIWNGIGNPVYPHISLYIDFSQYFRGFPVFAGHFRIPVFFA